MQRAKTEHKILKITLTVGRSMTVQLIYSLQSAALPYTNIEILTYFLYIQGIKSVQIAG